MTTEDKKIHDCAIEIYTNLIDGTLLDSETTYNILKIVTYSFEKHLDYKRIYDEWLNNKNYENNGGLLQCISKTSVPDVVQK